MQQRTPQKIVLAAVLTATACGGGPGLSDSSRPKNGSGSSSTAYMVPGGTVTAYRVDSDAQRGPAVGTATTDANGAFQLKLTEPTTGPLLIAVTATGNDTFLSELVRLMAMAEQNQSGYVRLADRLARFYSPAVHFLAASTLSIWLLLGHDWHDALMAAMEPIEHADGHRDRTRCQGHGNTRRSRTDAGRTSASARSSPSGASRTVGHASSPGGIGTRSGAGTDRSGPNRGARP